ncbi:EF-hand domain-containing protein [Zymomonas mobilis]|uniref:EF-hand domain-containing protein n=1 Tax=Zymomonas mobilis subsp. pomaceae (strain ATCC 29192 / DSM 22645 / JCM 10191 / CCUG 17912 / NBRC 13757 / NCIMB 11200 / NRRL B-4491 / Barker I) TaxID=579138 RepID=F8EVX5_ZYMMT|nr:histidine kinase [Zymomonas mobilis]AEI37452.1 hypothetical protein Zymop_0550 [Zymomonas mobilis subsp. pomaceae ATCC 29192]MDX5948819.1 histidine kinase [Zymomonas mobilis subsp. pomaceae]GEB88627.1 hypothetical protein ZMO02_02640 [Zymomonas mobilis subsp. pomaceae]
MKNKLPFIISGVAILIAVGVFFVSRSGRASDLISESMKSASPVRIYAQKAKESYLADKSKRHFEHYDLDHDQKVSRDEYLAGRRRSFKRLDKNQDGVLNFDEYAASAMNRFDQADHNHDGFLNMEDFAVIDNHKGQDEKGVEP